MEIMATYTLKIPLSANSDSEFKALEKSLKDYELDCISKKLDIDLIKSEIDEKLKVGISANYAVMVIKDLEDRNLFTMVQKAMQSDELQAIEIMLNGLWVSGNPVSKITGSLYAIRSASRTLLPLLSVADGELKKN